SGPSERIFHGRGLCPMLPNKPNAPRKACSRARRAHPIRAHGLLAVAIELRTRLEAIADSSGIERGRDPTLQPGRVRCPVQQRIVVQAKEVVAVLLGLKERQGHSLLTKLRESVNPPGCFGRAAWAVQQGLVQGVDDTLLGRPGSDQSLRVVRKLRTAQDVTKDLFLS